MIWQGVEAARGGLSGHGDIQASAAATASVDQADHDAAGGDADPDGAGHMQHHAMATLDTPLTMGVGRPVAEHIMLDTGLTPSADANTPLRPPKATPIACI